MNNIKSNIIGAIAILALLGVGWLMTRPVPQSALTTSFGAVSNTNAPAANTVLNNGVLLPNPTVLDYLVNRVYLYTDKALGLGNSTGVPINVQAVRQVMATATTTPCALQNPFAATSTANISILITAGTSTASTLTIATSTSAFSTTTGASPVTTESVGSNMQFAANADSGSSGYNTIVPPSGYVVVGAAGAPNPGFTYGGSCSGIFTSIQ